MFQGFVSMEPYSARSWLLKQGFTPNENAALGYLPPPATPPAYAYVCVLPTTHTHTHMNSARAYQR